VMFLIETEEDIKRGSSLNLQPEKSLGLSDGQYIVRFVQNDFLVDSRAETKLHLRRLGDRKPGKKSHKVKVII
ncbi:hypothetical protein C0584_03445, partial [Candidatus Parcubacteria bacterium]